MEKFWIIFKILISKYKPGLVRAYVFCYTKMGVINTQIQTKIIPNHLIGEIYSLHPFQAQKPS